MSIKTYIIVMRENEGKQIKAHRYKIEEDFIQFYVNDDNND